LKPKAKEVKPNSIPQEKNIFSINKGQSSKGKPSFDDTCFFYRECGHWEDDCELKQTIKQMQSLKVKFKYINHKH